MLCGAGGPTHYSTTPATTADVTIQPTKVLISEEKDPDPDADTDPARWFEVCTGLMLQPIWPEEK